MQNFEKRGWQKAQGDEWEIYWGLPWNVKQIFSPDSHFRLNDMQ